MSSAVPQLTDFIAVIQTNVAAYGQADEKAWVARVCPHCGGSQMLRVALQVDVNNLQPVSGGTEWLRCSSCQRGAVYDQGAVHPSSKPLRQIENLAPDDAALWEEVRTCLGSGAYMAAVMLCRKHLLHEAVASGLAPENEKGFSPGFAECVNHLRKVGVITQQMLEWVDPIKDVGNTANHKIQTITKTDAEKVARFTSQLLVLAHEMRMEDPSQEPTQPERPLTV